MVTHNILPKRSPPHLPLIANPVSGSGKWAQRIKVAPRKNCCPLVACPDYRIEEGLFPDRYCPDGSIVRLSNTVA